ncbi:LacI family DNA-binding transcriptional regulator [Bifidobacterium sp.]|uniref:LacI family DNA-binding transcriptional regulator n=1 Tax=Bifidobacterium sp. TaxID=41200 RepID=UPI0025BCD5A2|nr:LacI family DNA-binding transcriptional regulator [Bifidobacterium sp.]MCH4209513.1 LacI family transcriptional regulator [Bifidobacterium sp.]MCI1224797.1 LacI family transcriptional regulator [Bifidobacterium sp.]
MAQQAVTIRDVARKAGVAVSTASRALGEGSASPATRSKVRQAARELHFVPNMAARQLTSGRSNIVAIVITESPDFAFRDAFISDIVSRLMGSFSKANLLPFLVLIAPTDADGFIRLLRNSGAEGMVVVSFHYSKRFATIIKASGKPTVFVGKPPVGMNYPYVDPDQIQGGYLAGQLLVSRGRRHIAFIEGPVDMQSPAGKNLRTEGCVMALKEASLEPVAILPGPYSFEHGIEAMAAILDAHPTVDGVFAQSDQIAAGALHALHQRGKRVPQDVAVIGFDDFHIASATSPRLTTVAQPLTQLAQAATDMLIHRLATGEWKTTVQIFPVTLVTRESA